MRISSYMHTLHSLCWFVPIHGDLFKGSHQVDKGRYMVLEVYHGDKNCKVSVSLPTENPCAQS